MPFDLAQELVKRPTEDPMRWPTLPWIFWALSSSLMLHGVAYASLGFAKPRVSAASVVTEVVFEVAPPAPAPLPTPEPEPELKPAPEPAPTLARIPAPSRAEPTPSPEPQPEPAKALAPLDLAGVTLTNAGDDGFAMRTGNGLAFAGPIGPGSARAPTMASPKVSDPPARSKLTPDFVPVSDLSARPVPPALGAALRRNYPDEARRRAIGGTARVRARLDTSGMAGQVQIENESFPGFGEACRKTLAGSSWSAPRDRNGRAVTTEIRYTCRFEVEQ